MKTLDFTETTAVMGAAFEAALKTMEETIAEGELTIEPALAQHGLDRAGVAHFTNEHSVPEDQQSSFLVGVLVGLNLKLGEAE